jgi:hypothetical protein
MRLFQDDKKPDALEQKWIDEENEVEITESFVVDKLEKEQERLVAERLRTDEEIRERDKARVEVRRDIVEERSWREKKDKTEAEVRAGVEQLQRDVENLIDWKSDMPKEEWRRRWVIGRMMNGCQFIDDKPWDLFKWRRKVNGQRGPALTSATPLGVGVLAVSHPPRSLIHVVWRESRKRHDTFPKGVFVRRGTRTTGFCDFSCILSDSRLEGAEIAPILSRIQDFWLN